jgi:Tfp pilus assembly PilM family ATPase
VGMRIDSRLQQEAVHQNAPAYLVACGLAMRRFD